MPDKMLHVTLNKFSFGLLLWVLNSSNSILVPSPTFPSLANGLIFLQDPYALVPVGWFMQIVLKRILDPQSGFRVSVSLQSNRCLYCCCKNHLTKAISGRRHLS